MDFAIIGDSHECVEELEKLVTRLENEIPGVLIIYNGDYLDKGKNTLAMIDFMYKRVIVYGEECNRGNHESFVHGRLEGILGALEDPVKEAEVFGSQKVLLQFPEAAAKFAAIYEESNPFTALPGDVYVTHAPCKKEHIGHRDPKSITAQRNYRTVDRTIPTTEDLKWFYDEADEKDPLHIFGHMAHSGKTLAECQYKNKIFLDTGCVYGNGLSAVHIRDGKVAGYYFEPAIRNRNPGYSLPPPLGLR